MRWKRATTGRHILRMAILDPKYGYEIHEVLPEMLAELGRGTPSREDAALWLARRRARQILDSGEDPLPSLAWFYQVMLKGDHPRELVELGYLEDEFFLVGDPAEQRSLTIAALQNLLDPELCARRNAEATAAWQERLREAQENWPYVLNSPGGRALLKQRFWEDLNWRLAPILACPLAVLGWISGHWLWALFGGVVYVPVIALLRLWVKYVQLKQERRRLLLLLRYPEDRI